MKHTQHPLMACLAACSLYLPFACSAQLSYNAGDYIYFPDDASFLAGTNSELYWWLTNDSEMIDWNDYGNDLVHYNYIIEDFGTFVGWSTGTPGGLYPDLITWLVDKVDNYSYVEEMGGHVVRLHDFALGYDPGTILYFSDQHSFYSGSPSLSLVTTSEMLEAPWYADFRSNDLSDAMAYDSLNVATGAYHDGDTGTVTGTAAWAAGYVDRYSYVESTGGHIVRLTDAVTIPETSTTLLGAVGLLGMALRRRRA